MMKVKEFLQRALFTTVLVLGCGATFMARAADDYGCNDPNNDRITPMLALCSTHAYNIGFLENPSTAANQQAMRDVVALKTTVITQQMYKQYEYLDATIRRLKTQLEREILTTKLESAGASSGRSSGTSIGGNNGVAGAENCRNGTTSDVMNCLSRNLDRTVAAINSSDLGAAKRQIETDLQTLHLYDRTQNVSQCQNLDTYCTNLNNNRNDLNNCTDYMRVCITRNLEALQERTYNTSPVRMY